MTAVEDHHYATTTDPDGRPRCICGYIHPCPVTRRQLRVPSDDELELIALVEVGWTVFRAKPDNGICPDLDAEVAPPGGTVIGWEDDQHGHRRYRCLTWQRGHPVFHDVHATEVEPRDLKLPNSSGLRSDARRLAAKVAARKGVVAAYEVEMLRTAVRLVEAIA